MLGICSGGMIASMLLAHLADVGELDRVAAFSLMVTVLDQQRAGVTSALLSHKAAAASTRASREKGYLDGRALAEVFAWLRPNDLIWNYWVNNYLMGHAPKAFDILYWNADPVRMTAAMHHDFMDLALRNALVEPGAATMLGSPLDLGAIDRDTYVVAGIADHLCKWESCYQTTQLFGGKTKFVLSTSGHIAAMVNPPATPRRATRPRPTTRRRPPPGWRAPPRCAELVGRLRRLARRPRRRAAHQAPPAGERDVRAGVRRPGTYVHDR